MIPQVPDISKFCSHVTQFNFLRSVGHVTMCQNWLQSPQDNISKKNVRVITYFLSYQMFGLAICTTMT